MSETINMTMYDRVDEVRNLNRVEGFDPRQYMRNLDGNDGTIKQYLDVVYRKLWFRLKNPEGKIVKKLLKLTDQTAIVEARVYLQKEDPEDSYIASAFAQKYYSQDGQFGTKFLELAETAAEGRALANAGYGIQFADLEGEQDPNVVDAPLGQNIGEGINYNTDTAGSMTGSGAGSQSQQAVQYQPAPQNQNPAMNQSQQPVQGNTAAQGQIPDAPVGNAASTGYMDPAASQEAFMQESSSVAYGMPPAFGGGTPVQNMASANQNYAAGQVPPQGQVQTYGQVPPQGQSPLQGQVQAVGQTPQLPVITSEMTEEQIYSLLTYKAAASVVISTKIDHGKTLGQIAIDKPRSLNWYANDYKGPDKLLRVGARFLIDAATNRIA